MTTSFIRDNKIEINFLGYSIIGQDQIYKKIGEFEILIVDVTRRMPHELFDRYSILALIKESKTDNVLIEIEFETLNRSPNMLTIHLEIIIRIKKLRNVVKPI